MTDGFRNAGFTKRETVCVCVSVRLRASGSSIKLFFSVWAMRFRSLFFLGSWLVGGSLYFCRDLAASRGSLSEISGQKPEGSLLIQPQDKDRRVWPWKECERERDPHHGLATFAHPPQSGMPSSRSTPNCLSATNAPYVRARGWQTAPSLVALRLSSSAAFLVVLKSDCARRISRDGSRPNSHVDRNS